MAHKFDPAKKDKLDNQWRRENLPAVPTLEKLGLEASDIVADIGCGIGYFSIPAAGMLNGRNKVFAMDTSEEMLAEVERRAAANQSANIVTVVTDEYDLKLPDETVSFALLVNVLHEVDDRPRFMSEVLRILKPAGKVAILEWDKREMETGPPLGHRIGQEELTELLESMGISIRHMAHFADVHYGVVGVKKD